MKVPKKQKQYGARGSFLKTDGIWMLVIIYPVQASYGFYEVQNWDQQDNISLPVLVRWT